ncbi:tetratricopeptide repeat protein [Legionella sp.]|uniref:tetratricopeptide repeat protein n=1 Tax=Legionella sp. TaxID=459 RepID=UPI003220521B
MGPESVLVEVRKLDSEGRFSEIIELETQGLSNSDQCEVDFYIGKSYYALGEFEEAQMRLSRSLTTLSSQSSSKLQIQVRLYLGACNLQMENYSQSIVHLNAAKSLFESLSDENRNDELVKIGTQIYFYLAQSLKFENKHEEAIETLVSALNWREEPEDKIPLLLELGINSNLAKKYEQAESQLRSVLELLTKNPEENEFLVADLKQQLGFSMLKQNRVNPAIEMFISALDVYKKAVDRNEGDIASAQFMLGICYLRHKNYEEADQYLQQSLAVFNNPNLPMAELKQACAFIKWIAQDERKDITLAFHTHHDRSSFKRLEEILTAIEQLENQEANLGKAEEATRSCGQSFH